MPIEPTEPDVETNDAPLSLRDTLSQAFETTSEPPEPVADQVTDAPEGETEAEAAQRARDEKGQFTKEKKPAAVKPAPKAPVVAVKPLVKPASVVPGAKPVPTSAQPAAVEMKPPQSFRGPAKEAWAQVPEAVRIEVLRREKEIATQLQGVGEDRKYASTMKQAFAPFEAQIRAEGSTPEAAIGKLMNTAQLLRTGPPHLKAAAIASMINDFNIPLDGLVAALQGQPQRQGQPQQQQQHVDPAAIAEQVRSQLVQQLTTQRDTSLFAKATSDIGTFLDGKAMHGLDGNDYETEIRESMADIIERAAGRGSTITLERAYSLAAREHPEVSKVLEKKERAADATKAQASTQRARVAASTVRNEPATQPVTRADTRNLREAIEAAAEAASER